MKKTKYTAFAFLPLLVLSGCGAVGDKSGSVLMIYDAAALISMLVLAGYLLLAKHRERLFVLLFTSVAVVNMGYCALAMSQTLAQALWANRLAYFGSAFLPMWMLMIILNAVNIPLSRRWSAGLSALSLVVFLVAASPGVLDIYYREVTMATVGGVTVLEKVYGPWHSLYAVYLLGYFVAMVCVVVYAAVKQTTNSTFNVLILAIAVSVNLGVWLIGQLVRLDFEFLSVSYIISELFLLTLQLLPPPPSVPQPVSETTLPPEPQPEPEPADERYVHFMAGLKTLTPTEKAVFDAHVAQKSTREILEMLNIKENTLKFHNKNLYHKLGVSSRKELREIHAEMLK